MREIARVVGERKECVAVVQRDGEPGRVADDFGEVLEPRRRRRFGKNC